MKPWHELLIEAKQVGTIFHYTKLKTAIPILSSGNLKSSQESGVVNKSVDSGGKSHISFSRNIGTTGDIIRDFGTVRMSFDGNKISNKYKIAPHLDSDNYITRDIGEMEERVMAKKLDIDKYCTRIDILNDALFDYGLAMELAEIWRKKKYKFKINIVSKFTNAKLQDKFIQNTFS